MVKQRMSSVDVAGEVACLRHRCLGLRVANIYDLNAKTYVLKLAKSGEEGEKVFLLLESGVRFHTTEALGRDKGDVPSNFSLKLRKHVRTKRLEDVRQLGVDRIVDFVFGSGEATVHLVLELYAQGNIVLTDDKYEVLTLLRSHRDDDKGFAVMARHPYPMQHVRLRRSIPLPELTAAYEAAADGETIKGVITNLVGYGPAIAEHVVLDAGLAPNMLLRQAAAGGGAAGGDSGAGKKGKKAGGSGGASKSGATGQGKSKALGGGEEEEEDKGTEEEGDDTGAANAEPAAADAGAVSSTAAPEVRSPLIISPEQLQALHEALQRLDTWFAGLETAPPIGVISCIPPKGTAGKGKQEKVAMKQGDDGTAAQQESNLVYNDFNPILMAQLRSAVNLEFPTFDAALEEFFSKIEGQRALLQRAEAERQAMSKLDKIRLDQSARAAALAAEAAEAELRGALIEYNLDVVDAALAAINESLAAGMDWVDLERLIKEERRAGNPVAQFIHSLQLEKNQATLLLSNTLDTEGEEGDEDANARKAVKVTVDLGLSAHANAAVHYGTRKKHVVKQAKTLAANEAALKAAEKKAEVTLKQVRTLPAAAITRKPNWFERFNWFISSENYLVISGRDAQQNELIVKRYFKRGDVYVHADLHGASSTIVKNPHPDQPIPPLTLQEAGCACVCRSRAWDSKIVTSAWWVHHHQVSKTAPTGEYLTTGSFMIRGRKNFLPPQPLVFGFGFLFKLEDSCIAAHVGERAVRSALDADALSTVYGLGPGGTEMGGGSDDEEVEVDVGSDGEDGQAPGKGGNGLSALEAFMEGGYDPASRRAAGAGSQGAKGGISRTTSTSTSRGGTALSSAALASLGGNTNPAAVVGQYQRYNLDATALAEAAAGGSSEVQQQDASGRGPGGANKKQGGQPQGGPKKGGQGAGQQQQQKVSGPAAGKAGSGQQGKGGVQQGSGKQAGAAAVAAPVSSNARGKRGKVAKMKEKYGDQDEDERALALALLASTGEKKSRGDRRKERKEKKEAARQAALGAVAGVDGDAMKAAIAAATARQFGAQDQQQQQDGSEEQDGSSSGSESEGGAGKSDREAGQGAATDGGDLSSEAAQQLSGASEQIQVLAVGTTVEGSSRATGGTDAGGSSAQAATTAGGGEEEDGEGGAAAREAREREKAEVAALLAEENVAELADEERERLSALDSLTGIPRADDVLLYAIPVCGPYSTLQSYKLKVKLTPGTLKKGKVARQALELLSRAAEASPRERELLKAVPEMDMINALVGASKISMPGLAKLKAGEKKAKKSAARDKAAASAADG